MSQDDRQEYSPAVKVNEPAKQFSVEDLTRESLLVEPTQARWEAEIRRVIYGECASEDLADGPASYLTSLLERMPSRASAEVLFQNALTRIFSQTPAASLKEPRHVQRALQIMAAFPVDGAGEDLLDYLRQHSVLRRYLWGLEPDMSAGDLHRQALETLDVCAGGWKNRQPELYRAYENLLHNHLTSSSLASYSAYAVVRLLDRGLLAIEDTHVLYLFKHNRDVLSALVAYGLHRGGDTLAKLYYHAQNIDIGTEILFTEALRERTHIDFDAQVVVYGRLKIPLDLPVKVQLPIGDPRTQETPPPVPPPGSKLPPSIYHPGNWPIAIQRATFDLNVGVVYTN